MENVLQEEQNPETQVQARVWWYGMDFNSSGVRSRGQRARGLTVVLGLLAIACLTCAVWMQVVVLGRLVFVHVAQAYAPASESPAAPCLQKC